MTKLNIFDLPHENLALSEIKPYDNNPRMNDDAVPAVAASIKEFGWKQPIVVDKDHVIIAGHTRYKAAKSLGLKEAPCVVATDLTPEQVAAYRLADNKSSERSEWVVEKLLEELNAIKEIDMSEFGFSLDGDEGDEDAAAFGAGEHPLIEKNTYSLKTKIPQYEITGEKPEFAEMVDREKSNTLIAEIENAEGISDEERVFLKYAAERHTVFNYRNIAEYYAHATPEMQRLMEKSALVIIDVDDAIANGYAKLSAEVLAMTEDE